MADKTALERENAALEKQLFRQEKQAYIRRPLDGVMADIGYALVGERDVRKRTGAGFHHALYTTGDGTAVDVTCDANGQIAMEPGGPGRGAAAADRAAAAGCGLCADHRRAGQ